MDKEDTWFILHLLIIHIYIPHIFFGTLLINSHGLIGLLANFIQRVKYRLLAQWGVEPLTLHSSVPCLSHWAITPANKLCGYYFTHTKMLFFVSKLKHLPTAASRMDCLTTKHNLAGLVLRPSPAGFALRCWIMWLAHVCMSVTSEIISKTTINLLIIPIYYSNYKRLTFHVDL